MSPLNVVVIGGGIIGASIGWHLCPDANVTYVAEVFGGVATPMSFAWINAYTSDETYFDFRNRSLDHWASIHDQLPDLPIRFNGGLTWDFDTAEELEAYYDNTTRHNYGTELVDRRQIRKMQPHLTEEAIPDKAVLAHREGQMEPDQVALGLIHDSQASGGASTVEATVYGFLHNGSGGVRGVNTSAGLIEADHVVVAAGLGTVPLLAAEGLTVPVQPRQGLLVNTLPAKNKQNLLNELWWGHVVTMRQTTSGVIRAGLEETGGDPGDDPQNQADEVFDQVQKAFKKGKGDEKLEYGGYTIGLRPQPDDGFPILGRTGIDGLSLAVMHSGVSNGAMVGKLIAKEVLTNVTDPLLAPFSLFRF